MCHLRPWINLKIVIIAFNEINLHIVRIVFRIDDLSLYSTAKRMSVHLHTTSNRRNVINKHRIQHR